MEGNLQQDMKLTRAEREKERQQEAARRLYEEWPLPGNISDLKSYAIGMLTWRDAGFLFASFIIPIMLMMPFSAVIPQWLCVVIGAVIGAPFAFLSIKHVFTGDLPFEERLKISIAERGELNLLHWDKTKEPDGSYVDTSTQSFVPRLEFTDDNFAMLPDNGGGFAIIQISVDDMAQSKNTEILSVVNSFASMLNALIKDTDCTPVQILLKSVPKNLSQYIDAADERTEALARSGRVISSVRSADYAELLVGLDQEKSFYYNYYIIVTYREDAEHVAEETMNTASVKRKKIQEKGFEPINKKAKIARQSDMDVGLSEDERKKRLRELNRDAEFGRKRTKAALERRVNIVVNMLRDLGSTHTDVKPRLLKRSEMSKLIFECYNTEDKNVVDSVIDQSLDERSTMYSRNVYADFGDMFEYEPKRRQRKRKQDNASMLNGKTASNGASNTIARGGSR